MHFQANWNQKGSVGWGPIIRAALWIILGLAFSGCIGADTKPVREVPKPGVVPTAMDNLPAEDMKPVRETPGDQIVEDQLAVDSTKSPTLPIQSTVAAATEEPVGVAFTPTPSFDPATWRDLPVLPELSLHARAVLRDGIAQGNNPQAFSKIGDCESQTTWFLGDFDLGEQYYSLGPFEQELAPVIEYYRGSFNRLSLAAKPGFTAASLLSPIWANREVCQKGESPLACEYRIHRPIMALILIGTNDASNPKTFEGHMRKVIELSLEQHVLPVLGTKADNVEGDHAINTSLARLANEYDIPLWNYWLAVQELPGHGLQPDGAHLTFAAPHFDNPAVLKNAWPVRNLNALQILRQVMDETR